MNCIDMVYTYVNGNDSKYVKKIKLYANLNDIYYDKRYKNVNELNYSIKSVIKYMPFIRKIFIVTDNQHPNIDKYLYDLKPITIINHIDIIDSKYLPTFYSDVIESYIHNIPNLSEIFLYNNDDFFHFSKINISDIIFNNSIKIINDIESITFKSIYSFYTNLIKLNMSEYDIRVNNTKNILKMEYGKDIKFINNHCTKIFRKSTLKYIENKYSNLLDELRKNKFRDTLSINYNVLAINIDNILNNNIIIDIDNTKNSNYYVKYSGYNENKDDLLNDLINLKPMFCCLNDIPTEYKDKFNEIMNIII